MDQIHTIATQFPLLIKLESISNGKAKREHILIALSLLSLVLTLATPFGPLITSTIGIIVPLHETMFALKKRDVKRHYVIFWMMFGMLTAFDAYSSCLIRMIPFFYTMKLVFLIWAGPIRFEAGEFIYGNFLSKIPEEYYKFEKAEDMINQAAQVARAAIKEGKEMGMDEGVKRLVGKDEKKRE